MSAEDIARILAPSTSAQIGTVKKDPTVPGVMGIPGSILRDVTRPVNSLVGGILDNPLLQRLGPMAARGYASGRAGDPRVGMQMAAQQQAMQSQQQQAQGMAQFTQIMQQRYPQGPPIHDMDEMNEIYGIAGQIFGYDSEITRDMMKNLFEAREMQLRGQEAGFKEQELAADAAAAAATDATAGQLKMSDFVKGRETIGKVGRLAEWGDLLVAYKKAAASFEDWVELPDAERRQLAYQTMGVILNKILDPGSVVRESEFARVGLAEAYWDKLKNLRVAIETKNVSPALMKSVMAEITTLATSTAKHLSGDRYKDVQRLSEIWSKQTQGQYKPSDFFLGYDDPREFVPVDFGELWAERSGEIQTAYESEIDAGETP